MTEDGTYKIFTSRNRILSDRDTTSQKMDDVSSVGALPDFKAKKTSKSRRKTIKTLNKSDLKPPSTARRRSKRLNPDFEQEDNENDEQQRKMVKNKEKNDKSLIQIKCANLHIAAAKKQAINISFVRENLRANNKALAVALEHAKVEIKSLKNERIQCQTTIQELQSQLSRFQEDAKSFEARFEKALEECVMNKVEDVLSDFSSFNKVLRRKYLKNVGNETTILSLNSALNENVLLVDEEPYNSIKITSEKEISRSPADHIDTNNENLKLKQSVSEILQNMVPNFSTMFDKDDTIRNIENNVDNRNSVAKRGRRSNLWN